MADTPFVQLLLFRGSAACDVLDLAAAGRSQIGRRAGDGAHCAKQRNTRHAAASLLRVASVAGGVTHTRLHQRQLQTHAKMDHPKNRAARVTNSAQSVMVRSVGA